MNKKLILTLLLFVFTSCLNFVFTQSIEGSYMIGEQKAEIRMDEDVYYVYKEGLENRFRLQYEENTLENDQIWLEWQDEKQTGTFILNAGFLSGTYTNYRTLVEYSVKKLE